MSKPRFLGYLKHPINKPDKLTQRFRRKRGKRNGKT